MFSIARLHGAICASCRLRASIVTKQHARSRKPTAQVNSQPARLFATTQTLRYPRARRRSSVVREVPEEEAWTGTVEERVRLAREEYGDQLPEGVLGAEEVQVYERLFGQPFRAVEEVQEDAAVSRGGRRRGRGKARVEVLRLGEDGELEALDAADKVAKYDEIYEEEVEEGHEEYVMSDQLEFSKEARLATDKYHETNDAAEQDFDEEEDAPQRTHPLTLANRYGPSPTTVHLPVTTFVEPTTLLLSGISPVHLQEAAMRVFGGTGLPYSTSTPAIAKTMQQRPIALDAYQPGMSDIEGDVFMAVLMPAIYATVMGVFAETRKRLGTAWAEELVRKALAGELRILDAGGGGAGILAVREVLRAEWERMHEAAGSSADSPLAMAEANGKLGGAAAAPPLGHATVLTGSDALRRRASQLLDNTAFIPRLPDYVHTEEAKLKGKFDIILAPHTLWPLREDYLRRTHTQNLWSLLHSDGGVLLLMEKGVPRGFELVASARDLLLETRISSPEARANAIDIDDPMIPDVEWEDPTSGEPEPLMRAKEKGMIIAPCTNHLGCPMYVHKGVVRGRKDICAIEQRYIRPTYLQKILRARDKNYEDVKFSYLAVMRGRDLREEKAQQQVEVDEDAPATVVQGKEATELAFLGYASNSDDPASPSPHSLTLPRAILPPLKRRGHVILDFCTPSGTLERWTVPRSFSRQAYRDARKSQWGDLWALGAKTRVHRDTRAPKTRKESADMDVKGKSRREKVDDGDGEMGTDEYGRVVARGLNGVKGERGERGEGGKMRTGPKVRGIRDKRDKSGKGNGRVKGRAEEE